MRSFFLIVNSNSIYLAEEGSSFQLTKLLNYNGYEFEFLSELREKLQKLDINKNESRVHWVLDFPYFVHQFITLPQVKKRELKPLIQFELENTVFQSIQGYKMEYRSQSIENQTLLQVFLIKSDCIGKILECSKDYFIEVKSIIPFIDIKNKYILFHYTELENHIHIFMVSKLVKIYLYNKGKLSAISIFQVKEDEQEMIHLIQQRIKSIQFQSDFEYLISFNDEKIEFDEIQKKIEYLYQESIEDRDTKHLKKVFSKKFVIEYFKSPINLYHNSTLSLFDFKQFKFIKWTILLFITYLVFYIGNLTYSIFDRESELEKLKEKYGKIIETTLGEKVSKKNGLFVLKEKVQNLRTLWNFKVGYSTRNYKTSEFLKQLSQAKNKFKTFNVEEVIYSSSKIQMQATMNKESDAEALKTFFNKTFSYQYKVDIKTEEQESILFSIQLTPFEEKTKQEE